MKQVSDDTMKKVLTILDDEKTEGSQVLSLAYNLMLMVLDKPTIGKVNGELVKVNGRHLTMHVNLFENKTPNSTEVH